MGTTSTRRTHGHLLIPYYVAGRTPAEAREGVYITPAIFTDNGLAAHAALGDAGWTVTHVSSGAKLRTFRTKRDALALLTALASEDWTFHKDAVTRAHAERVREACGGTREQAPRRRAA